MNGPAADLLGLQDATDRLLVTVATLDDTAVAQPSRLPGWTRGHVLAHLARNADGLVNVLAGRPMYPSDATRNADIERDASRPPATHLADLRDSAARFADAADRLTDEEWHVTVTLRNGVTDRVASLPLRRWVEVELHHIDLDAGHTVADLPGAFTDRALPYLTDRFTGHPALPALELRTEDGRAWPTGGASGGPHVIAGTPAALVGWLSGRTPGTGLTIGGPGGSLPELPPL
ncbi:maleylpyruvate isomerase family mycothiol-dependent enzyme [Streptomyces sp. NBC_01803]|uniref:maleylpyruvate isomerase family mycothiol-dependent enzyme n=1 Tax=Streptomyces sp. NBC_01803 TaxID=2975946 RepID=UPI002DD96F62|nr:maleylpyruvate isomerase family mycothiol-dependent enzyme [Streptomyces sp. NBC_01803]WSA46751.1 maleylpyruvate isomerase family mycothiol-dependent enzyme [Streptomyces sp. NBC_01803]